MALNMAKTSPHGVVLLVLVTVVNKPGNMNKNKHIERWVK